MKGKLFLSACAGFLLGELSMNVSTDTVLVGLLLLVAGSIFVRVLRMAPLWPLGLVLAVSFWWGHSLAVQAEERWADREASRTVEAEFLVIDRDMDRSWYVPITLRPVSVTPESMSLVLWRAPRETSLVPGQTILFTCDLKRPENFTPDFDYARFLATRGIGWVCDKAEAVQALPKEQTWRKQLFWWRDAARQYVAHLLPEPASGLLQGLLLGGDQALAPSVTTAFRNAGLSHIVAVSGYNMSLVAGAMLFAALCFGMWRKTALVIALIGIGIFLLTIDVSAASLRAALMTSAAFAAFFLGRPSAAVSALFLAGTLMALMNPWIVRYDIGFQLSFLATLTLLVASPWIDLLVQEKRQWFWKLLILPFLLTLAIELVLWPVIAFHFGSISLLGPLANVVVLPLIPLAMLGGSLLVGLALVAPGVANLLVFPVWLVLMSVLWIAEWFGHFAWGILGVGVPSVTFLIGWYLLIGGGAWYSQRRFTEYVLRLDHQNPLR